MKSELDLLVGTVIDSLVKLDLLLLLHARAGGVQTADEISAQLSRPPHQVTPALDQLAESGLVERFPLGTGRHVLYGPPEDQHMRDLLAQLHDRYRRDPAARSDLVRQVMAGREGAEPEQP